MTLSPAAVTGFTDPVVIDVDAIREIKRQVRAMMSEREQLRGDRPSEMWLDFCRYFSYLFGLRDEDFSGLRVHTYHLTGDTYQYYYFADAQRTRLIRSQWDEAIRGLPADLILSEPSDGYGFVFGDHVVNLDILDYQRVVGTLERHGMMDALRQKKHVQVLEIGSGYGGLAHQLSCVLAARAEVAPTFVLVDLPEVFLYSASYLTMHHPGEVYVYEQDTCDAALSPESLQGFRFVCLPNYRLDLVERLQFDLAVNMRSLQEMRSDQVTEYLDLVVKTCTGKFYSYNLDAGPKNFELGGDRGNLSEFIRSRFEVNEILPPAAPPAERWRAEVRRGLRRAGVAVKLLDEVEDGPALPHREYLCSPRRST